ncbi:hypothetical protein EM308_12100 [Flavobacterium gilvum]|uniref:Uncharacterized protein n=1 Tax=Flavobacterium gilvum TaxID=1492737 RepID=A0AAC9I706_9FLAO|nr:hypothetical protein EM308_12100 [Flavobacterium gilvum]KFC58561.1 hypothetical protein FEM08_26510 [Flavobacterium gilvum]
MSKIHPEVIGIKHTKIKEKSLKKQSPNSVFLFTSGVDFGLLLGMKYSVTDFISSLLRFSPCLLL